MDKPPVLFISERSTLDEPQSTLEEEENEEDSILAKNEENNDTNDKGVLCPLISFCPKIIPTSFLKKNKERT